MLRRRVPVLRLGSRGPGGDARSLRLCPPSVRTRPQAFASVGKCRASSGVANRRETQNCRHFLRLALQKCQQSQGSRGSWSQNAELSSLLESSRVFASQKCQQSQGSGGSWSRNAELSSLLDSSSVNSHRDRGGPGRETQNCRHFWNRLGSSRLKSVNSHRDPGKVLVAKRRSVITFGVASGLRVSKVSTVTGLGASWSRNADLSSLLESSRVFVSQKCQQSQGSVTFGLASGERKGEMRGEKRGEKRDERRERKGERREERRETRDERREERGERIEERGERREERRVDRREERGERRGEERGERREARLVVTSFFAYLLFLGF